MNIKNILGLLIALTVFSCQNPKSDKKMTPDTLPPTQPIEVVTLDTIKTDSSQTESSPSDLSINKKMLAEFYMKNKKSSQIFTINNNKDTTLICFERTRITIKCHSLVSSKTGREITGDIKISIQEYYTISDILLAQLSTTANGNLLETGGMINILATSNQEKCILKNGKSIMIEIPRKTEKEGMQLYYGQWQNNGINWELDKSSTDLNQTFSRVDEMPIFPGGTTKMNEYINKNLKLTDDTNVDGTILTTIIIDKNGNVSDPKIIRGLQKDVDREVIKFLKTLPKFTPGKKDGIAVNVKYNIPITISTNEFMDERDYISSKKEFVEKFEAKYNDENLENAGAAQLNYYLFSSSKLGMINCDRLWKDSSNPKVDYAINLNENTHAFINIVFHRVKSIMKKSSLTDNVSFENIPSGEKITILAIKYLNKKPMLAVKETETKAEIENNLVFQHVSIETLKKEIKKLDRFN